MTTGGLSAAPAEMAARVICLKTAHVVMDHLQNNSDSRLRVRKGILSFVPDLLQACYQGCVVIKGLTGMQEVHGSFMSSFFWPCLYWYAIPLLVCNQPSMRLLSGPVPLQWIVCLISGVSPLPFSWYVVHRSYWLVCSVMVAREFIC